MPKLRKPNSARQKILRKLRYPNDATTITTTTAIPTATTTTPVLIASELSIYSANNTTSTTATAIPATTTAIPANATATRCRIRAGNIGLNMGYGPHGH